MKETYHVGYDPTMKLWDAQRIIHNFDPSMTVFQVIARNEHEAVSKGLDLYQSMMQQPTQLESKLISHIVSQVKKQNRNHDDVMMIEVPHKLMDTAKEMERKGFFKIAYQDEIILNIGSAGWKCMNSLQQKERRNKSRSNEGELSYV